MKLQGVFRNAVLVIADVIAVSLSWTLALVLYDCLGTGNYRYSFYLRMWPIVVCFVGLNVLFRLYHGRLFRPGAPVPPIEEFRRLVGSAVMTHLGAVAAIAIARQTTVDYSRAVMIIAGGLTAVVSQPIRDIARLWLRKLGVGLIPVDLVGEDGRLATVKRDLLADAYTGFVPTKSGNADIAVVCMDLRLMKPRLGKLFDRYAYVEYIPQIGISPILGAHAVMFDSLGGIEMSNQRKLGVLKIGKWVLDKVLAILTFVLLSPLFLVIPVMIKLTSRGSVFYRQKRLGRDGREIRVWKFRSMYRDSKERLATVLGKDGAAASEWSANHKLLRDPRVTPVGKWLRRTSLDELPQLFNVFAGDMALVGPRPIVRDEVPHYGTAYPVMSSVKPGVTGLWQVSGRSDVDYSRRVALDCQYVMNWSPWLDLWIMMRTVGAVLLMRGAY